MMSIKCLCSVMLNMCEHQNSAIEIKEWFKQNSKAPQNPDLELQNYEERLIGITETLNEDDFIKERLQHCITAFHKSYFPDPFIEEDKYEFDNSIT